MSFILPKIIQALLLPPAGILLLLLAGLFFLRKHPSCGRALTGLAAVLLYLLSIPFGADLLIRPLESSSPSFAGSPVKASAVVVLGGGVNDLSWVPAPPSPSRPALARLMKGVTIAKALHLPLILSGGSGAIDGSGIREADALAAAALSLGMKKNDLILEGRSRNTLENAQEVGKLVPGNRIVLVTSAFHMNRAAGMFRKQGFDVVPAPTDYLAQTRRSSWTNLLPRAGNLEMSSTAIAEYLSLAWYRLLGKA